MRKYLQKILIVFFLFFGFSPKAQVNAESRETTDAQQPIRIQLKWFHQFQFAGYYAAVEKGFYAEEGLDVVLLERNPEKGSVDSVLDGDAEYGIADSGLIELRAKGVPVTIVTQVYQHSPLVLVTLAESGIDTPEKLIGKKIMLDVEGAGDAAIKAMLLDSAGSLEPFDLIAQNLDLKELTEGRVDAFSSYLSNQPFILKQQGYKIHIINPINFGIDFYGDNLFTSLEETENNPDRVRKMARATVRGWEYALRHQEEIVDLILARYNPEANREKLLFEAQTIHSMILPDLYEIGNIDLDRIRRIAAIYHRLGMIDNPDVPENLVFGYQPVSSLRLSPEEQQWLSEHPMITLSVDDNYPPKNFRDENGELIGVSIDYMKLLESRLGTEIRFEGSSWARALRKALDHEVDGVINADMLEERKPYLNFTDVYAVYPQALVTQREEPSISSLEDFSGRWVAVKKQSSQRAILEQKYPEIKIKEISTLEEGLDLLVEGRVDGVFDDVAVLYHHISNLYLTNLKIAYMHYEPPVGYSRIGLRNDEPILLSVFDKAIDSLSEMDHRKIQQKWLGMQIPAPPTPSRPPLVLTEAEKNWLKEHPLIRVGVDPDWPPIEFAEKNGEFKGISRDYLTLVQEQLGIEFQVRSDISWAESLALLQQKEIDLLPAIAPTLQRRKNLLFTRSYFSAPVVIYSRDDHPYVPDMQSLEGERIGVMQGYAVEDWMQMDFPNLNMVSIKNIEHGLKLLNEREIDVFLGSLLTVGYHLSQKGYTHIKVSGETPYTYHLSMGVRKDWPMLVNILQKALDSIPEEEKAAINQKWIGVRYEYRFDPSLLWKASGVAAIIFLGILFWNYRLSSEVTRRTREISLAKEKLEQEIQERKQTETELRQSEERFRTLVDQAADAIYVARKDGKYLNVNRQACESLGYTREELLEMSIMDVDDLLHRKEELEKFLSTMESNKPIMFESRHRRKDGAAFPVEIRVGLFQAKGEDLVLGLVRDISDRKKAEEEQLELQEQLRQAQKMEAVGQLAGGVAHDFNNLLQVITGHLELTLSDLPRDFAGRDNLEESSRAAEKAARLVGQLLAFSRRQLLRPEILNMNEVVGDLLKMLSRLIGERISLKYVPSPRPVAVRADRGMIEQILMNLCVNARDAMPEGGTLTIQTDQVHFSPAYCEEHSWAEMGDYVELNVADTGHGMDEETLERIFEPFFTTKELGKGTGLGLSTVYGLVKQHEGLVNVLSKPGEGTRFCIYLPLVEEKTETSGERKMEATPSGRETILVAEDDEMVRTLARQILARAGYRVVTASDGKEAVRLYEKHKTEIDLLLLDVVMPHLNGRDVYEKIVTKESGAPVLFATGYSEEALSRDFIYEKELTVITKPYRRKELLLAVRRTLDQAKHG